MHVKILFLYISKKWNCCVCSLSLANSILHTRPIFLVYSPYLFMSKQKSFPQNQTHEHGRYQMWDCPIATLCWAPVSVGTDLNRKQKLSPWMAFSDRAIIHGQQAYIWHLIKCCSLSPEACLLVLFNGTLECTRTLRACKLFCVFMLLSPKEHINTLSTPVKALLFLSPSTPMAYY